MGATDMFYRLFWCFSGNPTVSASQTTGSQNQGLAVAPPSGPASCWCGFLNGSQNMQRGTNTRIGIDTAEIQGSTGNTQQPLQFDSIFQALQDVHTFAPLQTQHFSKQIGFKHQQFS